MSSTKSCWFVPKREFLLRISHCLIKILIPNIHYNINLSARHRKLKWNIVCSLVVVNCFFSFDIYHCHWVKGHFRNLKGTGAEMRPAIVSGIVTGDEAGPEVFAKLTRPSFLFVS